MNGPIFARILALFKCSAEGQDYSLALTHPYDAPTGISRTVDKDLELLRVRAKPRRATEYFSVESIIRGAALIEDFEKPGDYLVIDTIDGDMFLQSISLNPLRRDSD